ncbi:MAG: decarboxylase [Alphaproteobacteria bacterium]|nr:decarboxylase [Alphaproteobacteria bacterium]
MSAMPASSPRARVGLIIPSVNTYSEPQFNRFAPEGLGIHIARARVAGEWKRPLPELKGEIESASRLLSDCHPDAIVFHCTDTSMTQGPQGESKILDIVTDATGIGAMATSRLVLEGMQTLGMSKVVLLTPYKSNKAIVDYLTAAGVQVVQDVALKLEARHFGSVTPRQWADLARDNDRPDADGIFLSCTNTTQIDAIADIERELGKPVVNSNQAVLWGCLRRLKGKLAPLAPMPQLGRLMEQMN